MATQTHAPEPASTRHQQPMASLEGLPARIEALREALGRLPRVHLAHLPTPLDACPNLSRRLSGPDVAIKRDDCTGLAFGGNKARQLEYILGDAVEQGADCVIQGAASQSNHARQLAAAAAKLGMKAYLTPKRDARSAPVQGNYLVANLLGADVRPVPASASMQEAKAALADELAAAGANPYIVGMGATRTLVRAAVAYVGAFLEIVEACLQHQKPPPDWVYTTSQGGTQAGLQVGAILLDVPTRVVGINPMRSDQEAYIPPLEIADLVNEACVLLGAPQRVGEADVENLTDYVGPGYGLPSPRGREAMALLAASEGILLDPIYSCKGFSGLIDHIRKGRLAPDERVVFVHTGGTPAMFAYAADLIERRDT